MLAVKRKDLKLGLLQVLCETLELQAPIPPLRRNVPYISVLQELVNCCSCSAWRVNLKRPHNNTARLICKAGAVDRKRNITATGRVLRKKNDLIQSISYFRFKLK